MSKLAVELLKFGIDSKEILSKRLTFKKSQSLDKESDLASSVTPIETNDNTSTKPDKCQYEFNHSMTDSPDTSPGALHSAGVRKNPMALNPFGIKKMKTQ